MNVHCSATCLITKCVTMFDLSGVQYVINCYLQFKQLLYQHSLLTHVEKPIQLQSSSSD